VIRRRSSEICATVHTPVRMTCRFTLLSFAYQHQVHVLPNIIGRTLYVPSERDCDLLRLPDCGPSRGVEDFQAKPSSGFQKTTSSTWQQAGFFRINIGHKLGITGDADFGYDKFGLGSSASSTGFQVEKLAIAAYTTTDLWVGQLGLSRLCPCRMVEKTTDFARVGEFPIVMGDKEPQEKTPSLLSTLKREGRIPSLSFGYQIGCPYRELRRMRRRL
jgi:hypothetical protein